MKDDRILRQQDGDSDGSDSAPSEGNLDESDLRKHLPQFKAPLHKLKHLTNLKKSPGINRSSQPQTPCRSLSPPAAPEKSIQSPRAGATRNRPNRYLSPDAGTQKEFRSQVKQTRKSERFETKQDEEPKRTQPPILNQFLPNESPRPSFYLNLSDFKDPL